MKDLKKKAAASRIIIREFDITMNITQFQNEDIEIRDSAGIRIALIRKSENLGIWMYFDTRLKQYTKKHIKHPVIVSTNCALTKFKL